MSLTRKKSPCFICLHVSSYLPIWAVLFILLSFVIMTIIPIAASANWAFTVGQALCYLGLTTNRETSLPPLCRRGTEVQGLCQRRLPSRQLARLDVKFSAALHSASVSSPSQWVHPLNLPQKLLRSLTNPSLIWPTTYGVRASTTLLPLGIHRARKRVHTQEHQPRTECKWLGLGTHKVNRAWEEGTNNSDRRIG